MQKVAEKWKVLREMMMSLNFTKGNKTGNDIKTNNQPTKKKNKRQTKKAYILEKYVSSKVSKGIYLFF